MDGVDGARQEAVQGLLSFAGHPLYALVHEACYAQGGRPTAWSAERVRAEFPQFDAAKALTGDGPVLFTGESVHPWTFTTDPALLDLPWEVPLEEWPPEYLAALERKGALGPYGFRDALDYTRPDPGMRHAVVGNYMAHHVGMSLVAFANVLTGDVWQRRFHADPLVRAAELLLHERIPRRVLFQPTQAADAGQALPDPELERATFKVADGFEVNLFAADPLVAKPININFGGMATALDMKIKISLFIGVILPSMSNIVFPEVLRGIYAERGPQDSTPIATVTAHWRPVTFQLVPVVVPSEVPDRNTSYACAKYPSRIQKVATSWASPPASAPATRKVCSFVGGLFESGFVSTPTPLLLRTAPPIGETIVTP